ncbi:MAG: phage tail sheath family protein [Chitinophagaceae bacterium]
MAAKFRTSGIYINEIPNVPPSITAVPTSIPAFIGYTEKAVDKNGNSLVNKLTKISSLVEYEQLFGKAQNEENLQIVFEEERSPLTTKETVTVTINGEASRHLMHYSMQSYFANGGGDCYIISSGPYKALGEPLVLEELEAGLTAIAKEGEPDLIVVPEGQKMTEQDYYILLNKTLEHCHQSGNLFCIMDIWQGDEELKTSNDFIDAIAAFRNGIASPYLKYGAAYCPNIKTVFPLQYDETKVQLVHRLNGSNGNLYGQFLVDIKSSHPALYQKMKQVVEQYGTELPPSSAIAGVYVNVDRTRGIWKAPANVALMGVSDLTFKITNDLQEQLNVDPVAGKSINVIRWFTGKGHIVWGARTLAGNDNEWRYISIRRFFNMVEESCKKGIRPFAFEPNDANTWIRVQAMIENFLIGLWRQGALQGAKPEHAFFVAIGLGKTMTVLDVEEGRMITEIGLAAVRPAEFIIIRFTQQMQQ